MKAVEVNFDGIVGPTHHYGGLAFGNVASMQHESKPSNPKEAALQGLDKMKMLSDMGLLQAVLPPHERPYMPLYRDAGFRGSDKEILQKVLTEWPALFYRGCASSSMWTANWATMCPSCDSQDQKLHLTPANLSTMLHRAIEASTTYQILSSIFQRCPSSIIHPPLPYGVQFSDEGAANHTRFCSTDNSKGLHLFVYGRRSFDKNTGQPIHFPARQTLEASQAIARLHQLPENQTAFAQQNPEAIDHGVFHNDVISVGNQNLFLYHENSFINTETVINTLQEKFALLTNQSLLCVKIANEDLSLQDAVLTYFFNSQIASLPDKQMCLIAPIECQESKSARSLINKIIQLDNNPISSCSFADVRQSMQNGGGPACLRLRVILSEEELFSINPHVLFTNELYLKLKSWICTHYRDRLSLNDLADPELLGQNMKALDELSSLLELGNIYSFQRNNS